MANEHGAALSLSKKLIFVFLDDTAEFYRLG
jgi:hypothetical protein